MKTVTLTEEQFETLTEAILNATDTTYTVEQAIELETLHDYIVENAK